MRLRKSMNGIGSDSVDCLILGVVTVLCATLLRDTTWYLIAPVVLASVLCVIGLLFEVSVRYLMGTYAWTALAGIVSMMSAAAFCADHSIDRTIVLGILGLYCSAVGGALLLGTTLSEDYEPY